MEKNSNKSKNKVAMADVVRIGAWKPSNMHERYIKDETTKVTK